MEEGLFWICGDIWGQFGYCYTGKLMEIMGIMTLESYYGFTKYMIPKKVECIIFFQVSMLRIYIFSDPLQVLEVSPIELQEVLSFGNRSIVVEDWKMKQLRSKVIPLGKVLRSNDVIEEMTWETEVFMRNNFSYLFSGHGSTNFEDKIFIRGVEM